MGFADPRSGGAGGDDDVHCHGRGGDDPRSRSLRKRVLDRRMRTYKGWSCVMHDDSQASVPFSYNCCDVFSVHSTAAYDSEAY